MFNFILKLLGLTKEETPMEEKKTIITIQQLLEINNNLNKTKCEEYIDAFNEVLPLYGIDTPIRICHFLAQVLHESGHLKYETENLNYSASALRSVFGKYFKTEEEAKAYERQPEKIANRVYANRMGNGTEESGDGWKYRGRGLIQLTGRDNYNNCGNAIGYDLINKPDSIVDNKKISVRTACWFWNKNNLNNYADKDDILTITKRINGGSNGLEDRTSILNKTKTVYKI